MIITSDLHLTDRNRDEYRWEIFNQLCEINEDSGPQEVLILGDITDKKDCHSAILVNRVADEMGRLAESSASLTILKGNHDYKDATTPFFGFLDAVPNMSFVSEPQVREYDGVKILLLPHERDPRNAWRNLVLMSKGCEAIFAHQTFQGAVGSNGMQLSGPGPNYLKELLRRDLPIIAGDIHKPQTLGSVTYCGTPYPVAFGDDHEPSILSVGSDLVIERIYVDTIKKVRIDLFDAAEFDECDLDRGDQARVVLHLRRSEYGQAKEIMADVRTRAEAAGVDLYGFKLSERVTRKRKRLTDDVAVEVSETQQETLTRYCKMEGIDKALADQGAALIK